MPITFADPHMLFLVVLGPVIIWLWRRRKKALGHSQVSIHRNIGTSVIGMAPALFLLIAWSVLVVALARPQLPEVGDTEVFRTRDFIIATDISGSMSTSKIQDPKQIEFAEANGEPKPEGYKLIYVAEKAIEMFVGLRADSQDRVGLFLFDDEVYYSWPLTKDLEVILYKNEGVRQYNGGGTNFQGDGRGNGKMGPIQAAIDHFEQMGQADSKVLIMVSDGNANISDERMAEILEDLREGGIKVYTLGIGDDWIKNSSSTSDLRELTEATGGVVITIGDAEQMREGFAMIDRLERSPVEIEKTVSYRDIFQLFIYGGGPVLLLLLASFVFLREDN